MPTLSLEIERKCIVCGTIFRAKTMRSKCCSENCVKVAWKRRHDAELESKKIYNHSEIANVISGYIKVSEASKQFCIKESTLYKMVKAGKLGSVAVGARGIRVKISDLETMFPQYVPVKEVRLYNMEPDHCYTFGEIIEKFKVSKSTLWTHIRKYSIPTRQIGRNIYAPKEDIDKLYK